LPKRPFFSPAPPFSAGAGVELLFSVAELDLKIPDEPPPVLDPNKPDLGGVVVLFPFDWAFPLLELFS